MPADVPHLRRRQLPNSAFAVGSAAGGCAVKIPAGAHIQVPEIVTTEPNQPLFLVWLRRRRARRLRTEHMCYILRMHLRRQMRAQ